MPYIFFSPNAPQAVSVVFSGSDSSGKVSPSLSRNFASLAGLSGEMPMTSMPGLVELGEVVAEVAGLLGAARRARGRVEVHDHLAAAVVGERHLVAVGVGQGEVGGDVAGGEPVLGHSD